MSYEMGALIEPLSVGVHAARRADIDIGSSVLITGAGPIGMLSAIAARAKGACDIWITDVIDSRLGNGHIIDWASGKSLKRLILIVLKELAQSMGLKTLNVMGKSQKEVNDSLPIKVTLGISNKKLTCYSSSMQ